MHQSFLSFPAKFLPFLLIVAVSFSSSQLLAQPISDYDISSSGDGSGTQDVKCTLPKRWVDETRGGGVVCYPSNGEICDDSVLQVACKANVTGQLMTIAFYDLNCKKDQEAQCDKPVDVTGFQRKTLDGSDKNPKPIEYTCVGSLKSCCKCVVKKKEF